MVYASQIIYFRYELCSYPPALFDSSLFLREPQKPVLVNSIWEKVTQSPPVIGASLSEPHTSELAV